MDAVKWSPAEVDFLRVNAACGIVAIADQLGRSQTAVRIKAHDLAVSLGRGNAPAWSALDQFLLKAMARFGAGVAAGILSRSVGATRFRAQAMGISLERSSSMTEALEEASAIMEHDGGWPRPASDAMAAACRYMFRADGFHVIAKEFLLSCSEDIAALYDRDDPLATQVSLAKYAFDAIGTIDAVRKADRDLADLFQEQRRLWERSKSDEDRQEHAGGMVRAYLALSEKVMGNA